MDRTTQFMFILSLFWLVFLRWFAHLCFGFGRGPITPPCPAMAGTGRKDLNSKTNKTVHVFKKRYFRHIVTNHFSFYNLRHTIT